MTKRKFDVAKLLMTTDDQPSKAQRQTIQKVVKRSIWRQQEVKSLTEYSTGTLASAATGNIFFMPVPARGTGAQERIGDKYKIVSWEVIVSCSVNATAASDLINVGMVNIKQPNQTTPATYDYVYDILGSAAAVALKNPSSDEDVVTEYKRKLEQLTATSITWSNFHNKHKFKYPLLVACTAGGGASSDVNRNLLAVVVAGLQTTNMSGYRVSQRIEFIDA